MYPVSDGAFGSSHRVRRNLERRGPTRPIRISLARETPQLCRGTPTPIEFDSQTRYLASSTSKRLIATDVCR